jgi:hypothetical protein
MIKKPTSQQRASKKQDVLRKKEPRYQLRMSHAEAGILNRLAKVYGSKKSAIITALKLLDTQDTSQNVIKK